MSHLIPIINIIEALDTSGWLYVAIVDDVTCEHCLKNEDQKVYSDQEIDDKFPDLRRVSDREIYPNVHMTLWGKDTCRCMMFRYEEGSGRGDGEVPPMPSKSLSDSEFDDWLSALLAAGIITAAIYDKVMARRKKKKKVANP